MKKLIVLLSSLLGLLVLGYFLLKNEAVPHATGNSLNIKTAMSTENLWNNAVPQSAEKRVFRTLPDLVHRISLEEHEIFEPTTLTTGLGRYLALYDYGHHQVFLFDTREGYSLRTLGDGSGKGPREFINPTDLAFDGEETLWIADPKLARITGFTAEDELTSNLHLEDVLPFRIAVRESDLIVLAATSTSEGYFFQFDLNGNFIRSIEHLSENTQLNSLLTEGDISASYDEIYYTLRHAGIIRKYDADLNLVYTRGTIDPVEPAQVETVPLPILGDAVGHRIAEDSRVAALDIAATEEYLYVLFSGAEYAAYFYLDVYDLQSGDYLHTHKLEHPANEMAILNDVVWVKEYVDRVPHLSGYRLN